jgi:hypothetical protein
MMTCGMFMVNGKVPHRPARGFHMAPRYWLFGKRLLESTGVEPRTSMGGKFLETFGLPALLHWYLTTIVQNSFFKLNQTLIWAEKGQFLSLARGRYTIPYEQQQEGFPMTTLVGAVI